MKTGLYLGETSIGRIVVTSTNSNGINLQSKTIIPTKSSQTITADNNYEGLSSVIVQPIPDNYIDTNVLLTDTWTLTDISGNTSTITVVSM